MTIDLIKGYESTFLIHYYTGKPVHPVVHYVLSWGDQKHSEVAGVIQYYDN
jgi:hypothetical protein